MASIQTRKTYTGTNFICFIVGMIMVWHLTHDGWVLFWTFVASLHLTTGIAKLVQQDPTFLRGGSDRQVE